MLCLIIFNNIICVFISLFISCMHYFILIFCALEIALLRYSFFIVLFCLAREGFGVESNSI